MSIPIPDYESEVIKEARNNLKAVLSQLGSKDKNLWKKIHTFAEVYGFKESDIAKKIRDDEMFRATFAVNPGRQKLHENIAANFIQLLPRVESFEQLPHNALQLVSGGVMAREEMRKYGASGKSKSIDFRWNTCGFTVYASHKYTKASGGAQDNQYRDLQEFIEDANKSTATDTVFLAIADGEYYQGRHTGTKNTRLEYLKDLANNKRNVFAVSIGELEAFLEGLCKK